MSPESPLFVRLYLDEDVQKRVASALIPAVSEITANFTYIRWIGDRRARVGPHRGKIDRSEDLARWADTINGLETQVSRIYGANMGLIRAIS